MPRILASVGVASVIRADASATLPELDTLATQFGHAYAVTLAVVRRPCSWALSERRPVGRPAQLSRDVALAI